MVKVYDPVLLSQLETWELNLLGKKPNQLTDDERILRRKLQNKLSAAGSRERKKRQVGDLEYSTQELQAQLEDSNTAARFLKSQVNELLCILGRCHGYSDDSYNTPLLDLDDIDELGYEVQDDSPLSSYFSLTKLPIRPDLLNNLIFVDPKNGILEQPALSGAMGSTHTDNNVKNDLLLHSETRTTRRQAAALLQQNHNAPITSSISSVPKQSSPAQVFLFNQQVHGVIRTNDYNVENYIEKDTFCHSENTSAPSTVPSSPSMAPSSSSDTESESMPSPNQSSMKKKYGLPRSNTSSPAFKSTTSRRKLVRKNTSLVSSISFDQSAVSTVVSNPIHEPQYSHVHSDVPTHSDTTPIPYHSSNVNGDNNGTSNNDIDDNFTHFDTKALTLSKNAVSYHQSWVC